MRSFLARRGGITTSSSPLLLLLSVSLFHLEITRADKTAADYFVHSLPGAPEGPLLKMHAGHIEVTPDHHGNLFFWHYQNRHIGDRQRTVVWLNGGPGCSSMDGAMMEIGPYRVREGGKLEYNPGSWDEFANVLFVDNPVGTGFSYVDSNSYIHELQTMSEQFVDFMDKWFALFPEYEHDDLYLAGESYAGQHIPYIAQQMLMRNDDPGVKRHWNLKGLLIGNGWTSPMDQYPAYLDYAYKRGLIQGGSDIAKTVEAQQAVCMKKLADGGKDHVDTGECEEILQEILRLTVDKSAAADQQCINMYDVRLRDSYSSCGMNWPPDLTTVTPYLRDKEVIKALHVNPDKHSGWTECSGAVSGAFRARGSAPAITLLPHILESVPTILFSGDQDLICNHVGTEELIHNMAWNGGTGFELAPGTWAPRRAWTFEGEPAGIYQSARNLTYVLFYNASHMVPYDFPRRTRDMLDRFMGVDIGSIGGTPSDSRIDGEKAGVETSVGGHPNSTVAEQAEADKLHAATRAAYYRSGEAALIVVALAAGAWAWYVWRDRRGRRGYRGVAHMFDGVAGGVGRVGSADIGALGMETLGGSARKRDLEAADFDAAELDDMSPSAGATRYSLGSATDDDDDDDDAPARPRRDGGRRPA